MGAAAVLMAGTSTEPTAPEPEPANSEPAARRRQIQEVARTPAVPEKTVALPVAERSA
jgi:hypothetical protein